MIADYEGDITKLFEGNEDGELPVLATRNLVLFPGVVSPVLIGRTASLNLVNYLKDRQDLLGQQHQRPGQRSRLHLWRRGLQRVHHQRQHPSDRPFVIHPYRPAPARPGFLDAEREAAP